MEKAGPFLGRPFVSGLAGFSDVSGLRALRTVDDLELDRLAFLERPEAVPLDRREMNEYVTAAFALDETVALGVVEPLDLASNTHVLLSVLRARGVRRAPEHPNLPCSGMRSGTKKAANAALNAAQ